MKEKHRPGDWLSPDGIETTSVNPVGRLDGGAAGERVKGGYIPVREADLKLVMGGLDEYWETLPEHATALRRVRLALQRKRTTWHRVNALEAVRAVLDALADALDALDGGGAEAIDLACHDPDDNAGEWQPRPPAPYGYTRGRG